MNDVFEALNAWATSLTPAKVVVSGPKWERSAVTVDIELPDTVAQVCLWPDGSLDMIALDFETEAELLNEHHEAFTKEALLEHLDRLNSTLHRTHTG